MNEADEDDADDDQEDENNQFVVGYKKENWNNGKAAVHSPV